ncbi:hypothetical protein QQ056_07210 [Oscillatoria laete-virens NRMC-F 0139]|nr:hypothetical protein [Oscillatoria laete-virens]MDL5053331.1 hypothetical protein [Oscillatoria laete-virens NRMC-F 0139]
MEKQESSTSELSPLATMLINKTAKDMIGKGGFTNSDLADLRQELTLYLLERIGHHRPDLASEKTFFQKLLENKAWKMIRRNRAQRRDVMRERSLLSTVDFDDDCEPITLQETIVDPASTQANVELRADVNDVLDSIPADLRKICELLRTMSWRAAMRKMRIPKNQMQVVRTQLQEIFTAAGLAPNP